MVRLLICDDSDALREVLRTTLTERPEITVVGEAADGREAIDLALALSPDVILMDVRMPAVDGVEATREITRALPDARVVALTGWDDREVVAAMLEAGAAATCVKGAPLRELERVVIEAVHPEATPTSAARERRDRAGPQARPGPLHAARVLVVGENERLRRLLRTTLEVIDLEIAEAADALAARASIAARRPAVVVIDLALPGPGGPALCEELRRDPRTGDIGIVALTGGDEEGARAVGADACLRQPFSPLDLLAVVEQLAEGSYEGPFRPSESRPPGEQVIRYAEDLRRLLVLERGQRALIQEAYRQTVGALASALEAKDLGTNAHSHRVQQYAMELAWTVEPGLLEEPSIEYGFLLHDVGKIGIPDRILNKPGALTGSERRILETHVLLGEQMLAAVALLQGGGLEVVRHHHERWDGDGYPDRLGGREIPLPARIFAVADALDAMTSERPYRRALGWDETMVELIAQAGRQFDPGVVDALLAREPRLRAIHADFAAASPGRRVG